MTDEQVQHMRRAAAAGENKATIARDLGCSRRLVYDVLAGTGAYAVPAPVERAPMVGAQEVELPLAGR